MMNKLFRITLLSLTAFFLNNLLLAQTSGPTQPELNSFGSSSIDQMVDLFTGDFSYSIPLFTIPGPEGDFPLILSYSSNISMAQEASWVGLGWNLNIGSISRQVRGIPDDFNGEILKYTNDRKPNDTFGFGGNAQVELSGGDLELAPGLSTSFTGYFNSYNGFGYTVGQGVSAKLKSQNSGSFSGSLDYTYDNIKGPSMNTTFNHSHKGDINVKAGVSVRKSYFPENSGISFTASVSAPSKVKNETGDVEDNKFANLSYLPSFNSYNISFSTPTYPQSIPLEEIGVGYDLNIKGGGEVFWGTIYGGIQGFYRLNSIKYKNMEREVLSYGSIYHQNNTEDDNSKFILDFNREKESLVRENTPFYAIPTMTYDIYNVNAIGLSGTFRAYHNEIIGLNDPSTNSANYSSAFGVDVAGGLITKVGLNGQGGATNSTSLKWQEASSIIGSVLSNNHNKSIDYESVFFKFTDDISINYTNNHWIASKSDNAECFNLDNESISPQLSDILRDERNLSNNFPSFKRSPRSKNIQYFTNKQLINIEKLWPEFTINTIERSELPPDQIGAFLITNEQGIRYTFSLPAYINEEVEKHFSVEITSNDFLDATVNKDENDRYFDNSEEFLQKKVIPQYAYAHYLTSILGTNYIDVDDVPGPSNGDLGFWLKFNYTKMSDDYRFRAPYNGSKYTLGFLINSPGLSDDKAFVTEGSKEIWYLNSAETKTHIAFFFTSNRNDGLGKNGERIKKLDSIKLFAKKPSQFSYTSYNNNIPIKTIHFEYNYSLTQGIPNNINSNQGKLSLKRLWFNFKNNNRGRLNPYVFDYKADDLSLHNPAYHEAAIDPWGVYNPYHSYSEILNFPYTKQSDTTINYWASAWNLKGIDLPTGGRLEIDYESDTYSFVQNKNSMQMVMLEGLGNIGDSRINSGQNNYIYFKIDTITIGRDRAEFLLERYFENVKNLKFNILINVKEPNEDQFERIKGYAEIKFYDVVNFGRYYYGRVLLKPFKDNYHPFALAAWKNIRVDHSILLSDPVVLSEYEVENPDDVKQIAAKIMDLVERFMGGMANLLKGFHNEAKDSGFGSEVILSESYMKLNCPLKKYGGGSRVKRIKMIDNWKQLSDEATSEYGKIYYYENQLGQSYGVAQYEPTTAADENPIIQPVSYSNLKSNNPIEDATDFLLGNDDLTDDFYFFQETPVNENYYPAPLVGYEKVEVRSLHSDHIIKSSPTINFHSTGVEYHHFNTSKNFPVKTGQVLYHPRKIVDETIPIPTIGVKNNNKIIVSQGYFIELNNMNGKPKKTEYYGLKDDGSIMDNPMKSIQYFYNNEVNLIKNEDIVINKPYEKRGSDLMTPKKSINEYEMFFDSRKYYSKSESYGANLNIDVSAAGPIPIPIPPPYPDIRFAEKEFKSIVTNKIKYKNYLLEEVKTIEDGVLTSQRNLAFDALTKEPVLTATLNNFDDTVYNYQFPAHIFNLGMRASYTSSNTSFRSKIRYNYERGNYIEYVISTSDLDGINVDNFGDVFTPGDEILINKDGKLIKAYVDNLNFNTIYIHTNKKIESDSNEFTASFIVVRSGARNMLKQKNGYIRSLSHPIKDRLTRSILSNTYSPSETTMIDTFRYVLDRNIVNTLTALPGLLMVQKQTKEKYKKNQIPISKINKRLKQSIPKFDKLILKRKEIKLINDTLDIKFYIVDNSNRKILLDKIKLLEHVIIDPYNSNIPPTITFRNTENGNLDSARLISDYDLVNRHSYLTGMFSIGGETTASVNYQMLNNIIDAKVITYSDDFIRNNGDLKFNTRNESSTSSTWLDFNNNVDYANGRKGIWRIANSMVYDTKRTYNSEVNIKEDGLIQNLLVYPFSYKKGEIEKWRLENKVEQYSTNNYPIQILNNIKIPSSSLYAYNNSMNVAQAYNALNDEICFEGFEEYNHEDGVNENNLGTGNFDFKTIKEQIRVDEDREELELVFCSEDFKIIKIPPEFASLISDPSVEIKLEYSGEGSNRFFNDGVFNFNEQSNYFINGNYLVVFNSGIETDDLESIEQKFRNSEFSEACNGEVIYVTLRFGFIYNEVTRVSIDEQISHTGKNSLAIEDSAKFIQDRLDFQDDKQYLFSCWVHKNSIADTTFKSSDGKLGVKVILNKGTTNYEVFAEPTGNIINGWQKIEFVIDIPEYDHTDSSLDEELLLSFYNSKDKIDGPLYIDDLRIHPFDSNMETYVYDNEDYKLKAILDKNNFATLYGYNENGKLHIEKKETNRGIYTIKEYRIHVNE